MALMNRGISANPWSLANTANGPAPTTTPPPATPPGQGGTPQYADVFNYLNPGAPGASWAKLQNSSDPTAGSYVQDSNGNQIFMPTQQYSIDPSKVPSQYQGLVQGGQVNVGANPMINYNLSKLPNGGKLAGGGSITDMVSLGTGKAPDFSVQGGRKQDQMIPADPKKVQWDPNYGWVMPKMNVIHPPEDKSWLDYVGQAAQMGMGMAMPVMGLGMGLAQGVGNAMDTGNWGGFLRSAAPGLAGAAIGASGLLNGLPSGLMNAINWAQKGYGLYNGLKSGNPYSIGQIAAGPAFNMMRGG